MKRKTKIFSQSLNTKLIDISATDIHLIEAKYGKEKTKILGKL